MGNDEHGRRLLSRELVAASTAEGSVATIGVHDGMSFFVRPAHRDSASINTALTSHGCHMPLPIRHDET